MAAPDFSDISKPLDGRIGVSRVAALPLPAYGDLSKAANDVSWTDERIETTSRLTRACS